ncbi:DUF4118 domain-containing protein [Arthrobacter cheniae]|uniref:DUF4118 domain-containing protein n=1 Tax=Arthrobacter cheniae TaxID=1258888 RepID=UPI0011C412E6|nr:DUF4118 domain-containing protein [Arthrobacter cheniae]
MTEASEGQRATGTTSAESHPRPRHGSGPSTSGSSGVDTTAPSRSSSTASSSTASSSTASSPTAGDVSAAEVSRKGGASPAGSAASTGTTSAPLGPSEALLGPFTLREVIFGGGVALAFIGTLLPFIDGVVRYSTFWNSEPLFFIGIGILLPVVAAALIAGRRLGSAGLRVGSLSVDQFASVAAVLAATYFFLQTVTAFHYGPLLALIGSLGMLAATVVGSFLPVIRNDFADRPEIPAHTAARPITAARPRPPKPARAAPEAKPRAKDETTTAATSAPVRSSDRARRSPEDGVNPAAAAVRQNGAGLYGAGGAGAVGAGAAASGQSGLERASSQKSDHDAAASADTADRSDSVVKRVDETRVHDVVRDEPTRTYAEADSSSEDRSRQEPITATRSADEEPVVEAFWFAVGSPRPAFDEQTGREVFTLQPGDWEVGIEDRGREFLVQDKRTGAVGVLRDLRNIERAPRD